MTAKTKLKRLPFRAITDRAVLEAILKDNFIAHVAFVDDDHPYCIPMVYATTKDHLILHGALASRALKIIGNGAAVCATITLVDGIVLARSAFNHSVNYRSVCVFGRGSFAALEEKATLLKAVTEQVVPGRWQQCRQPNEREIAQTAVVKIPLTNLTGKERFGPPSDHEDDLALSHWAGTIAMTTTFGPSQAAADLANDILPGPEIAAFLAKKSSEQSK